MTIDISQNDFGTLCVCALRYCHGRRTYMPSLVQNIVMAHFKDLSDRDLKVIAEDEQFQSDMSLWGDTCDKVDWENFYKTLRAWQNLADNIGAYEDTADTPQTERKCIDCRFLTYMYGKTWCNIKCDNPRDKVCDRFKPKDEQTDCGWK